MSATTPERAAMAAAIDWMVLLQSGRAGADAPGRLQHWLDSAPLHRQAWDELQQVQHRFERLRDVAAQHPGQTQQARELLLRPARRSALRSLAVLAVTGAGAAAWADRQFPLRELGADLRTATAQRRRFALDDGSSAVLDARSAVDVVFDGSRRQLWLRRGRVLLEAAADPRPLLLHGLYAQVALLRGNVMLERDDEGSTLSVLRDHALLHGEDGSRLQVQAGFSARATARGLAASGAHPAQVADWVRGQVSLDNAPLSALIARLRPYRPGFLRVSDAAAALRVQGVFALDDSDRTLRALAETLPLTIRTYGPITLIDRR
ncbi:FecR domain-containing protein [Stenotrophomonas sp. GZD-301]|uniref:FecR domain-containing protein n=1 Tax=Stenotrophomonas sp. GZD-301 TaxID=3404814 RepID=UPI003BB6F795